MSTLNLKRLCASIRLRAYIVGSSFLAELQSDDIYCRFKLVGDFVCFQKKNCSPPVGRHISGKNPKHKFLRALNCIVHFKQGKGVFSDGFCP